MPRVLSLLALIALLAALTGLSPALAAPPEASDPSAERTENAEIAQDTGSAEQPEPAADPEPTADPTPEPTPSPETTAIDPLRQRAERIRALMAGTLDLSIDPASLFVVDLADPSLVGPGGERLLALLQQLAAPAPPPPPTRKPSRRRPPEPEPEPEPTPAEDLAQALETYLRLTTTEREAVLTQHARRRDDATALREAASRARARETEATQQADRLEAFLDGTLDLTVDPRTLLTLDLASDQEAALSTERRQTWAPAPPDAPDKSTPPEPATQDPAPPEPATEDPAFEELRKAEARLDGLRRRFLALPAPEQAGLFTRHQERIAAEAKAKAEAEAAAEAEAEATAEAEAEQTRLDEEAKAEISSAEAEAEAAEVERDQALEEARLARTEATRILAEERARLLQIKSDQALHEAELKRRRAENTSAQALEWSSRVSKLDDELFGAELERTADGLYPQIRADLAQARARLDQELRRVREPGTGVPRVGEGLDRELSDDFDRGEISELREELLLREQELVDLERELAWSQARDLRNDVEILNDARLQLLRMASGELRDDVTGFGPRGVDQARSELEQISLVLGFHVLQLPRYKDMWLGQLEGSPVSFAWGVVQLLLVMLGLWWWRRRWPTVLKRLRLLLARRRPMTSPIRTALVWLWYFDRIRRPLELLLALRIALSLLGGLDFRAHPELVLLWIIVRWILIGLASILLLDAIAARDTIARHRGRSDSSPLRIHSLRVVGLNVIAVGLILSLTDIMVGHGAIYRWVISTCWVLSVPVALYLVHRWRPIIVERLEQHPTQGPFVKWARERQTGWIRYVASTAAAGYLFGHGLGRWSMRHLGGRETTRRILAYLFRREVAKRAAASARAKESLTRVDQGCYTTFDPEFYERNPIESIGQAQLEQVVSLVESSRSTLTAVIGERGKGKTSFLRRLEHHLGTDRIKVVACPEVGLEGLMLRIAAITGDREAKGPALAEALRQMGPMVIAIDDAQRLIQPAIRGLRELDALTAFAREVGGKISWVIAMGSSAWHYLKRARGNRVFFEQVVELPRWTEEQLGQLIRSRCVEAKIDPSFEGLVVPRSVDPLAGPDDGQRTEAGYYRLLWDFSRGNPAVALHAFRESLFVDTDEHTVVRLFQEPPAKEIESLSLPLLFVLRAVVQLDVAQEHELIAATQLPAPDVSDALRFCLTRGYVERYDVGVRVAWHWFRTITAVLQRQHLLSTST